MCIFGIDLGFCVGWIRGGNRDGCRIGDRFLDGWISDGWIWDEWSDGSLDGFWMGG